MLSPFSFVRCCFSSQSCRPVRLELLLRFFRLSQEDGKHQSLRRSDAGRCRESKTTGQRVHEFSFFIACSSSSIFWFVREQTLDGVSCAENERNGATSVNSMKCWRVHEPQGKPKPACSTSNN
ncbi:hypothetical protein YC2023_004389 [Brassica napus]